MKGSAKQIKWAEDIRAKLIASADEELNDAKAIPGMTDELIAQAEANHDTIVKGLMTIDDAVWFIEHRVLTEDVVRYAYEIGQTVTDVDTETVETAETADEAEADKVERVIVLVPKDRVFKTNYGWGLILDRDHVQWINTKSDVWYPDFKNAEVTMYRDAWNPKMAKRPYDEYDVDENETKWSTWVKRADEYKGYGN